MANIRDLANQVFGRLTAIRRSDQKYKSCFMWECTCTCGEKCLIPSTFLINGISKSCGCLRRELATYDLIGQTFSRLTAIRASDKRIHNCIVWECLCTCGKTTYKRSDHLVRGIAKSCGCLHDEIALINGRDRHLVNLVDGTNIKLIQSDKLPHHNTSGVKGVSWHKGSQKWQARIAFKGNNISLGYFVQFEDAVAARTSAELRYFGEFLAEKGLTEA